MVDVLDIILVFQNFEKAQILPGDFGVWGDEDVGHFGELVGDKIVIAGFLERAAKRHKIGDFAEDGHHAVLVLDVDRAVFQREHHQLVDVLDIGVAQAENPAVFEHPVYAAIFAQIAVMLGEHMPNFGDDAVSIIGRAGQKDRHAAGAITLIIKGFIGDAFELAGALFNRTLNRILGHIGGFGLVDIHAHFVIGVEVPAAAARRRGDLLDQCAEDFAALGVFAALFMLNIRPFTMSSHRDTSLFEDYGECLPAVFRTIKPMTQGYNKERAPKSGGFFASGPPSLSDMV